MSNNLATRINKAPGFEKKNMPLIREVELPGVVQAFVAAGHIQAGTRRFRMGKANILLSPPTEATGWHMTISRDDHYPSWDEVAYAWYSLVPDAATRTGVMILPPLREYINIHEHCFQVHEELR
ncbi:MAG: hypothetical protein JNJ61_10695 [Anaerolineae bacterium]|nr:hypothetical protein [Anaerolineae bacterium]